MKIINGQAQLKTINSRLKQKLDEKAIIKIN